MFGLVMIVATLSLVGTVAYTTMSNSIQITGYNMRQKESFHQADAGVLYVISEINKDIEAGTVTLSNTNLSVNYPAPNGYTFDAVTNLTQLSNPRMYLFEVTGRSGPAKTTIEGVVGQLPLLRNLGVFGDENVLVQPGFEIYSYDSTRTPFPTPLDSTGDAGVGSNGEVTLQPGASLEGRVLLGEDTSGTVAAYAGDSGISLTEGGRISPDPLGAVGGALADVFAYYSIATNNDNASAGITGNRLRINAHTTNTLNSGKYYLNEFDMGPGSELYLDGDPDDPVLWFVEGPITTLPTCTIENVGNSPRSFFVFCNTSDTLRFQPGNTFKAIIYAPYADLRVQPGNDAYGVFWAKNILLQPVGDLYVDNSVHDDFISQNLHLVQWKELR
jgi:hypothetical protein